MERQKEKQEERREKKKMQSGKDEERKRGNGVDIECVDARQLQGGKGPHI